MPSRPSSAPSGPELRRYTSWRGLLGARLTPLSLLGPGVFARREGGPQVFPLLLVLTGGALLLIASLDYPHTVRIGVSDVSRHTVLRIQHLPWDRIVAFERTRPARATVIRNVTDRRDDRQVAGGLAARGRSRRRWLLTDRVESRSGYARRAALLAELDQPVRMRAARPHVEAPPIFLHRRQDGRGPRGERREEPPARARRRPF